jgi:hypothetical protein
MGKHIEYLRALPAMLVTSMECMSSIRREDEQQNPVVITVGDKILHHMAAMAIKYQQLPSPLCLGLGVAIEDLFKPR